MPEIPWHSPYPLTGPDRGVKREEPQYLRGSLAPCPCRARGPGASCQHERSAGAVSRGGMLRMLDLDGEGLLRALDDHVDLGPASGLVVVVVVEDGIWLRIDGSPSTHILKFASPRARSLRASSTRSPRTAAITPVQPPEPDARATGSHGLCRRPERLPRNWIGDRAGGQSSD